MFILFIIVLVCVLLYEAIFTHEKGYWSNDSHCSLYHQDDMPMAYNKTGFESGRTQEPDWSFDEDEDLDFPEEKKV